MNVSNFYEGNDHYCARCDRFDRNIDVQIDVNGRHEATLKNRDILSLSDLEALLWRFVDAPAD